MKIPKIFTPDKNLDTYLEKLLSEKPKLRGYDENTVIMILKRRKAFLDKQVGVSHLDSLYRIGERLIEDFEFTKEDIEEAIRRVEPYGKEDRFSGFYFSALINKVITEKDIMDLKFYEELAGLGAYLKAGTLSLDGYVCFALGHCMEGGEIIMNQSTGTDAGNGMEGGRIVIHGDAGNRLGIFSKRGEIVVYGNIKQIAETCRARVFNKHNRVWPRK
ncbi:hypothetical protein FJZ53_00250 [Candidatus Woesearchaeota archaeon]|nr:hypothetical protein [Candidatus Woesearchaeota archaeon]